MRVVLGVTARVRSRRFFKKNSLKMRFVPAALSAAIAAAALALVPANLLADATKVACVGDSITFGYLIPTRAADNYPKILGELLGPDFEVKNFGNPGKTCGDYPSQRAGKRWYGDNAEHAEAVAWQADIYIGNLGINDTGAWWNEKLFVEGYERLIKDWRGDRKNVPVFIWTKLAPDFRGPDGRAAFPGNVFLPEFSFPKADNGSSARRPTAEKLLAGTVKKQKLIAIDAYSPLAAHPEMMLADGLHPNAAGARRIAEFTFAALVRADLPKIKIEQKTPKIVPAKDGKSVKLKNAGETAILLDGAKLSAGGNAEFAFENATVIPPRGEISVSLGAKSDQKDPALPLASAKIKKASGIKFVPAGKR